MGNFRRKEVNVIAPTSIAWRAAEHRVVPPFPTSDRALQNVKFRIDRNDEPTSEEDRRIEGTQEWDTLAPELFIDADASALVVDTGVPADDIEVSVICRDRILCKFERAATWPLRKLPADGWPLSDVLDRFSRSTRFDVVVVATLRLDAWNRFKSIPAAALLATKCFKIRVLGAGIEIPIKFVEPDELVAQGLDRGSVCFVRWAGEDMTRPPRELLEVWLNKAVEDKFRALNTASVGTAAAHIASSVAAQVYAEVIAQVLVADDLEGEPESLTRVVGDLIEKELGIEIDEARRQFAAPGGRARLVPWSWKLAGTDVSFASMTL